MKTEEEAMTSLDAGALVHDVEGMAFLRSVLEIPEGATPRPDAFSTSAARSPGWTANTEMRDDAAVGAFCGQVREAV